MRRLIGVVVFVVAFVPLRAQTRGAVDWIFLVDTSQSMRGVGGSKDIFGDVKESIRTFIRSANAGDSVSIYTFDRDVQSRIYADIRGPFEREETARTVDGLRADGKRTHLGAAIAQGLERSEALLAARNDPTRQRAIVLFTDGKEDVRGIEKPTPISSNVSRVEVSKPFIFFVSMGAEHEAQLGSIPRSTTLRLTDGEAIRQVAEQIRAKIPAPEPQKTVKPPREPEPPSSPPSLFARIAKWAIAIVVLLAIAVIGLVLYTGKQPGELLASLSTHLEGEIEILKPRAPADATFIGLPGLKAKEVALSSIVPVDALAGSDARLFCRRSGGEKTVWIAAQSGSLRVNDIEVPMSELYDADTIQIGDAKLRFNRVGFNRASEEDRP